MSTIPRSPSTALVRVTPFPAIRPVLLENFLDDAFARVYTDENRKIREHLEKSGEFVHGIYTQRITSGTEFQDKYVYDHTSVERDGYIVHLRTLVDRPNTNDLYEGEFYIGLRKVNEEPFTPQEMEVIDNYPFRFAIKSSSGIEVAESFPVTLQKIDDKYRVYLAFYFNIETGKISSELGNETYDDQSRIIKLTVKSPVLDAA